MTDPSVSERRIRPIQDAIANSNWKHALQLCDKWSKKGERSDHFLVLKASVLVHQADAVQRDRGTSEVLRLCHREPAITDLDALHELQDTLRDLHLQDDEGPKLWSRAATAKPSNQDLLMAWLERAISENQWISAQKATMALRKAFPAERKYEFWNILMCFLVHDGLSISEKERATFGMLAYRMISRAAEAVPLDAAQSLSSGKAIHTPEELNLLVKIFTCTGHGQETVKLLQSNQFGLSSRFAELDSQLNVNLLLETLESSVEYDQVFNICKSLVSEPKYREFGCVGDDRVWQMLIRSSSKSQDANRRAQTKDILKHAISDNPGLRSPRLGLLLHLKQESSVSQESLVEACQEYYKHFKGKPQCFDDLLPSLNGIDQRSVEFFLGSLALDAPEISVATIEEANKSLLDLKLQFHFQISQETEANLLLDFAAKAIQLYQNSLKATRILPEACQLAAISLSLEASRSKASSTTPLTSLLAVVPLLTHCSESSEDFFPSMLMLISTYLTLGTVSAAMMHFKKLSIKNMQWETLGHIITSRISTLHPEQFGRITPSEAAGFNPYEALDLTLSVTDNSSALLIKGITQGLNTGSYVNVIGAVKMKTGVERSLNRQVALLEERRVQRARGIYVDKPLPGSPGSLVDNREFSSFSVLDGLGDSSQKGFATAPIQKEVWITVFTLLEQLFQFLRNDITGHPDPDLRNFEQLRATLREAADMIKSRQGELTEAEEENFQCHAAVAEAMFVLKQTSVAHQSKLEGHVEAIKQWLKKRQEAVAIPIRLGDLEIPDWKYLHTSFSCLETLHLLTLFITSASTATAKKPKGGAGKSKTPTISKESMKELQDLGIAVQDRVHGDARRLKEGLNAPGVLGKLIDIILGKNSDGIRNQIGERIEELCGATALETCCGELKDSWEDALGGILAVKLKWHKP